MPKGSHPNSKLNLKKGTPFTAETASANGKKGAMRSNQVQAEKRDIQKEMQAALDMKVKDSNGNLVTVRSLIVLAQVKKALNGESKAFDNCGTYSGEKPAEKQQIAFDKPNKFVFVLKK